MDTINSEQKAADSKSQDVHDSLIKGLKKEITDTKAVKVNKEALYDEALGEFNKANKQPKAADAAHTDAEEHKAREGSAAGRCIRCSDAGNCDVLEEGDEGAERGVGGRLEGPQYRDALSEMADIIPAINWSKDAGLLLIQELT